MSMIGLQIRFHPGADNEIQEGQINQKKFWSGAHNPIISNRIPATGIPDLQSVGERQRNLLFGYQHHKLGLLSGIRNCHNFFLQGLAQRRKLILDAVNHDQNNVRLFGNCSGQGKMWGTLFVTEIPKVTNVIRVSNDGRFGMIRARSNITGDRGFVLSLTLQLAISMQSWSDSSVRSAT